jgi:hypothetical protein
VDAVQKAVHVRFTQSSLESCEGRIPVPGGFVSLHWTRTADSVTYQLDVPAGYSVQVENVGQLNVVQKHFPHGKVNFGYKIEGGYK